MRLTRCRRSPECSDVEYFEWEEDYPNVVMWYFARSSLFHSTWRIRMDGEVDYRIQGNPGISDWELRCFRKEFGCDS